MTSTSLTTTPVQFAQTATREFMHGKRSLLLMTLLALLALHGIRVEASASVEPPAFFYQISTGPGALTEYVSPEDAFSAYREWLEAQVFPDVPASPYSSIRVTHFRPGKNAYLINGKVSGYEWDLYRTDLDGHTESIIGTGVVGIVPVCRGKGFKLGGKSSGRNMNYQCFSERAAADIRPRLTSKASQAVGQ